MTQIQPPASRPCGSCPYRCDAPSGLWHADHYNLLPKFDRTPDEGQPAGVFMCHQNDGRLCGGWVAVHDMEENIGLRIALVNEWISPETFEACLDYDPKVPVFESGAEARDHGMHEYVAPNEKTRRTAARLTKRGAVYERSSESAS